MVSQVFVAHPLTPLNSNRGNGREVMYLYNPNFKTLARSPPPWTHNRSHPPAHATCIWIWENDDDKNIRCTVEQSNTSGIFPLGATLGSWKMAHIYPQHTSTLYGAASIAVLWYPQPGHLWEVDIIMGVAVDVTKFPQGQRDWEITIRATIWMTTMALCAWDSPMPNAKMNSFLLLFWTEHVFMC